MTTSTHTRHSSDRATAGRTRLRGARFGVRLTTALLALLAALTGVTLSASPANALVGQYVTQHRQWGDCALYIGTVPRADYGAVGGADVWCNSTRSKIATTVSLWRYNGARWVLVSSGTKVVTGSRSAQAQTAYPSYIGGCASWDITATVNVDGFQISIDYGQWAGSYPRYDPTHPPFC